MVWPPQITFEAVDQIRKMLMIRAPGMQNVLIWSAVSKVTDGGGGGGGKGHTTISRKSVYNSQVSLI